MRRRSNLLLIGRFVLTMGTRVNSVGGTNNHSAMESAYFPYARVTSENQA